MEGVSFEIMKKKEKTGFETEYVFYKLGKRDAVADILMTIRIKGVRPTLYILAKELLAIDKKHPYAKWILANIEKIENFLDKGEIR